MKIIMGFIRFLLILNIITGHLNIPDSLFGSEFVLFVAVPSFFIISGFFISYIYINKYAHKSNAYWLFLTNRFLRVYPVYWLILSATIIYNCFFAKNSFSNFISNFTLILNRNYFNINPLYQRPFLVPLSWFLAIELLFYVIAPFLVKRSLKALLILLILSIGIRLEIIRYCIIHQHHIPQIFFPASLVYFILGICSYRFMSLLKNFWISQKYLWWVFILMISFTLLWNKIPIKIENKEWLYFLSLVISMPLILQLFKHNTIDKFVGELTYPMYLSHELINQLYIKIFGYQIYSHEYFFRITLIIIVVAVFIVILITKPIDKFRQRRLITSPKYS